MDYSVLVMLWKRCDTVAHSVYNSSGRNSSNVKSVLAITVVVFIIILFYDQFVIISKHLKDDSIERF